jgi:hypothetical protein
VSRWLRIYLGHPNDTIECFARAMRLSPLDSFFCFGCTGMAFAEIRARGFEEAASWATRATHEQSNWASTWRIAAIAYGLFGRVPEVQAAIARMREIDPDLRISTYLPITCPSDALKIAWRCDGRACRRMCWIDGQLGADAAVDVDGLLAARSHVLNWVTGSGRCWITGWQAARRVPASVYEKGQKAQGCVSSRATGKRMRPGDPDAGRHDLMRTAFMNHAAPQATGTP